MTLTSGAVCRLARIPQNTLDRWVTAGLVCPTNNGVGNGKGHRLFSVVEATAIVYGAAFRQQGLDHASVAEVIRFVANQTPEQMERQLAKGPTLVVPLPGIIPTAFLTLPKDRPLTAKGLDLQAIYNRVSEEAARPQLVCNQKKKP